MQDTFGWTPLHYAASCVMATGRVLDLIKARADVNSRSKDGLSPLHCAVMAVNLPAVTRLVKAGADVNALDSWGYTPLHRAALNGHAEIFDYLLPFIDQTYSADSERTDRTACGSAWRYTHGHTFVEYAREGLRCVRGRQRWQYGTTFRCMERKYEGGISTVKEFRCKRF